MSSSFKPSRVTVPFVRQCRQTGRRISALTAYDFTFARLFDEAGIDILLVGDSLGMVVQGCSTTLPVTLDDILYHSRMVVRGVRRALVVADLPFGSYQVSTELALQAAIRLVKEGGVGAVKLEGGRNISDTVQALTRTGIPVMGHIGLTPQSYHQMGGHKVQGRAEKAFGRGIVSSADEILEDAVSLEKAGAFSIVLECIPMDLARTITEQISVPAIGIGAGPHCSGQILVMHDMLGLAQGSPLRFVRRYDELGARVLRAASCYREDIETGRFPSEEEAFSGDEQILPFPKRKSTMAG